MKIGFIISMYDEIKEVNNNINIIKRENYPIVVIQSDPGNEDNIMKNNQVNHYELLPDLAGSKENYLNEWKGQMKPKKGHQVIHMRTPGRALSRNFSHGFSSAKNFDVDWWISLLGDMRLSNLIGIKNIIKKMENKREKIGFTRAVGLRDPAEEYGVVYTRTQRYDSTDFYAQFFIVNSEFVKKGLFNDIKITHTHEPSIILGDTVKQFCEENSLNFWDVCYSISDYPLPKWIEGVKYNPDRVKLPNFFLGPFNWFRRVRMRIFFPKKDIIPKKPDNWQQYIEEANNFI